MNKVWIVYCHSTEDPFLSAIINIFSSFEKANEQIIELIDKNEYEYSFVDDICMYKVYDNDNNVYVKYEIVQKEVL